MNELILTILAVAVLISIVYELSRERDEPPPSVAREIGWQQAAQGFGREDWPIDYSDAEREAWQAGWDEYHERK